MIELHDLIRMPGYDPGTDAGRGDWALRNVSERTVQLQGPLYRKPICADHGALSAVNPDRSIWRCLICGRGCFVTGQECDSFTKEQSIAFRKARDARYEAGRR